MNRTRPTPEESAERSNFEATKKAFAKTGELPHRIIINIGDWSDDGHGKTDDFTYGCNKPMKAVAAAYKKAAKKLPDINPSSAIFRDYEDHSLTEEAYFTIFDAGYDLLHGFNLAKERKRREKELPDETWADILKYPQIDPKELSLYIIWFCQQGDPELVFSEETSEKLFGYAGIRDGAGYGLFH